MDEDFGERRRVDASTMIQINGDRLTIGTCRVNCPAGKNYIVLREKRNSKGMIIPSARYALTRT